MPRGSRSLVVVPALIGFAGLTRAQAPTLTLGTTKPTRVVETGRLFVYRRQNLIGTERYEVEPGDTLVMRATHGFSDRTRPASEVTAELHLDARLTPTSYQLRGDRTLSVKVEAGMTVIRDEAGTRQGSRDGEFLHVYRTKVLELLRVLHRAAGSRTRHDQSR